MHAPPRAGPRAWHSAPVVEALAAYAAALVPCAQDVASYSVGSTTAVLWLVRHSGTMAGEPHGRMGWCALAAAVEAGAGQHRAGRRADARW